MKYIVPLLVAILAVSPHVVRADEAGRPNIILFMTDDQGYGDAGYMGHEILQTPVLDEMAATGLRLDNFRTASPICSPTRASVLTGRHPSRIGVFRHGHALRPQERTVATLLRDAGYRTGFFGKWHVGAVREGRPTTPGAHGFDEWFAAPNYYMNDPWFSHNGEPVQLHGEGSMVTVEAALPFIRKAKEDDKPFLLFIWTGSPHEPHEATEELQALYADQPDQLRNYYGEITGIDHALGRLRDELRELDIHENTLLMFTSDNGGWPDDGSELLHLRGTKRTLWDGGLLVPTVLEWPGRLGPRISRFPGGTVDLFPTFLELTGVSIPTDRPLDGMSLVALLEDEIDRRPTPLGFWHNEETDGKLMYSDAIVQELKAVLEAGGEGEINEGKLLDIDFDFSAVEQSPGHLVWLDNEWKLHRLPGGEYLLFNLEEDPGEEDNIIDEHTERAEAMKKQMYAWRDACLESLRGEDY